MSYQKIIESLADDGSSVTVTISGTLTIEGAAELQKAFAGVVSAAPRVALDLRQLEDLDMTILQMLCSACKTAAADKRSLVIEGELPACLKALNVGIGAHMAAPCHHNNNETCIFFGGAR